jgi:hypothetical protein
MTYEGPVYKSRIGAAVDFTVDFLQQRWREGDLVDKLTVSIITPIFVPAMTASYYFLLKPEVYGKERKPSSIQETETS